MNINSPEFYTRVDEMVAGVITSVGAESRGQQASMVYELLEATVERRLPGVPVDHDALRIAAARIAVGLPGVAT